MLLKPSFEIYSYHWHLIFIFSMMTAMGSTHLDKQHELYKFQSDVSPTQKEVFFLYLLIYSPIFLFCERNMSLPYYLTGSPVFDKPKVVSRPTPTRESFKEARQSYTFKIKVVSLCKQVPKKLLNLTPAPKIAPKSPKSAKRHKIWPNEKQKDRAVLPKQKVIVYIYKFQKCF